MQAQICHGELYDVGDLQIDEYVLVGNEQGGHHDFDVVAKRINERDVWIGHF